MSGTFKILSACQSCNPNTIETEAGGSQVQGQPRLHSEILSRKEGVLSTGYFDIFDELLTT
jgi:hypothetical protein